MRLQPPQRDKSILLIFLSDWDCLEICTTYFYVFLIFCPSIDPYSRLNAITILSFSILDTLSTMDRSNVLLDIPTKVIWLLYNKFQDTPLLLLVLLIVNSVVSLFVLVRLI